MMTWIVNPYRFRKPSSLTQADHERLLRDLRELEINVDYLKSKLDALTTRVETLENA